MFGILDVILVVLMLLIVVSYTKKGCKTLLHILSPIVSFGGAYFFGPKIGELLVKNAILTKVSAFVEARLSEFIEEGAPSADIGGLIEALPEWFINLLGVTREALASSLEEFSADAGDRLAQLAEQISGSIATLIASAIGCIAVFIVLQILMHFVIKAVLVIVKLPVIRELNYVFGFLTGVVSAFAYTWILCIGLGMIANYQLIGEYNETFSAFLSNSFLFAWFCQFSPADFMGILNL